MWISNQWPLLAEGDAGGAGAGGDAGEGDQGAGSIMSQGQKDAGAGGQEGGEGAAGAGGAGDSGQGGDQGEGAGDGWLWAEGINGTGERPPWFNADKYKTVDAQARASIDLEKKLGPAAELIGAPEGDYEVPALTDEQKEKLAGEFDADDPLYKMLATKAKELGLSQKVFNEIATAGALAIGEQNAADEQKTADALAALGENVDARVADVNRIVEAIAGKEGYKALDVVIGNDVAAFAALEKILAKAAVGAQLAGAGAGSGAAITKEDIESERYKVYPDGHKLAGKVVYEHDKEHRAKVDGMYKQLFPGEDVQTVG